MSNVFWKFWNNASHPRGFLGRCMIRLMNWSHTPSAKWNLARLDWQPDWTVLDIGCGGGVNVRRMLRLCERGRVYGIDISEESVRCSVRTNRSEIGRRCFIQQGSADDIPHEDGVFDVVTAFETIFFWPSLEKCMSEVYRVLKPGGIFMFDCGMKGSRMMDYFEQHTDGMRLREKDELLRLLGDAGFVRIEVDTYRGETMNFRASKPVTH